MTRRFHGNALIEYGAIGAILMVGSLVMVLAFGTTLEQWLSGLKGDVSQRIAASEAVRRTQSGTTQPGADPSTNPGSTVGSPSPSGPGSNTAVFPRENVCFNSVCITIPVVPGGSITTAGVNGRGATYEFAEVIEQIADQLAQDPNADPEVVRLIRELANRGYRVGDEAAQLDQFGSQQGSNARDVLSGIDTAQTNMDDAYSQLNAYLAANPGRLPAGIQALINLEVQQINTVADGYVANSEPMPCNTQQGCMSLIDVYNDAQLIYQSADTICTSGGGGDCTRQG